MKQIENVTSRQIGDVLKSTIKHAGLTQDEAGIKAGIPRNSLNRKLNGGTFNFDELARISQGYCLSRHGTPRSPAYFASPHVAQV